MTTPPDERSRVVQVGAHALHIEPPDILLVRHGGDVSPADTRELVAWMHDIRASLAQPLFWLIDLDGLGSFGPESRRVMGMQDLPDFRKIILFGGSFQQRVILKLSVAATAVLFTRRTRTVPQSYELVTSEAEARALVERERAEPVR